MPEFWYRGRLGLSRGQRVRVEGTHGKVFLVEPAPPKPD